MASPFQQSGQSVAAARATPQSDGLMQESTPMNEVEDADVNEPAKELSLSLTTAIDSLPLYVLKLGESNNVPADQSQMVAINIAEKRHPAIVLNNELLQTIKTSLTSALYIAFERKRAKAKDAVLSQYAAEVNKERHNELRAEFALPDYPDPEDRQRIADRLAFLNEKLRLVNAEQTALDQHVYELGDVASKDSKATLARLLDVFRAHGLMEPPGEQSEDDVQPDQGFVERWTWTPRQEQAVQDPALREQDHRAPERSARRRESSHQDQSARGIPSHINFRSESIDIPQARTNPPLTSTQLPPAKRARRDFRQRTRDFRVAQSDFDNRWGDIGELAHETPSTTGRRLFAANNHLTRQLIQAEERFRQARHHCKDLGVDVQYDGQTSSFLDDPDSEERFREMMVHYIGPERYPEVEKWVDAVEEVRKSLNSIMDDEIGHIPADQLEHEGDWDDLVSLAFGECCLGASEGRAKERIKKFQIANDGLRVEAEEHRARFTADLKRASEGSQNGNARGRKKRKVTKS